MSHKPRTNNLELFCDVVIPRTPLDELTYSFTSGDFPHLSPGDCVRVPLRGRQILGVVFRVRGAGVKPQDSRVPGEDFPVQPVSELVAEGVFTEEMLSLIRWVAGYYVAHLGEVLGFGFPIGVIRSNRPFSPPRNPGFGRQMLRESGVAEVVARELPKSEDFEVPSLRGFGVWVSCKDGVARERLVAGFLDQVLARGSVLFLLPEACLPEWLPLLNTHFGELLVEYHNIRGRAQRQAWFSIAQGQQLLVLGVRAAVWAPVRDLSGVVIIDEHWDGFKEERKPRYNARDVAIYRAKLANCPVLLLSRTLTLETYWNIKRGRFHLLGRLPKRSFRQNVFVVDMRRHRDDVLSPRLVTELRRIVEKGGSALCYINRKGLSRYVVCGDCGVVLRCSDCGVPVVLTGDRTLECRYCGFKQPAPDNCPGCNGLNFVYRSPGVKMVMRKLGECGLKAVEHKEAGQERVVIVGTRGSLRCSLLKNLRLFGVVNLDTEYALPDFRSRERTFLLLKDICHWAELYNARVVIQTYRPDEMLIDCVRSGDVRRFLELELAERREANFPPFRRLVVIEFRCANVQRLNEQSARVADWLSSLNGIEVFGPLPKPGKLAVSRLLVKMPVNVLPGRIIPLNQLEKAGIKVRIDVDPRAVV